MNKIKKAGGNGRGRGKERGGGGEGERRSERKMKTRDRSDEVEKNYERKRKWKGNFINTEEYRGYSDTNRPFSPSYRLLDLYIATLYIPE